MIANYSLKPIVKNYSAILYCKKQFLMAVKISSDELWDAQLQAYNYYAQLMECYIEHEKAVVEDFLLILWEMPS